MECDLLLDISGMKVSEKSSFKATLCRNTFEQLLSWGQLQRLPTLANLMITYLGSSSTSIPRPQVIICNVSTVSSKMYYTKTISIPAYAYNWGEMTGEMYSLVLFMN